MKLTKILLEHNKIILWLSIIWTAIVTFLCLASFNELPKINVDHFDKIGHISFHFGITFLWFLTFKFYFSNENKKAMFKAFLFSFLYGITIEILQDQFTTTRSGDPFDVLANSSGTILALIAIQFALNYSKKTSRKIN